MQKYFCHRKLHVRELFIQGKLTKPLFYNITLQLYEAGILGKLLLHIFYIDVTQMKQIFINRLQREDFLEIFMMCFNPLQMLPFNKELLEKAPFLEE